jgi:hypothetical protein
MKKLFLLSIVVLFFMGFAFAQEKEKSPMYYKGVDAGMSPEETVKILGEPIFAKKQDEKLQHLYRLEDDTTLTLFFHKSKWLYRIAFNFSTPVNFKEFGLTEEGGQGFQTQTFDFGKKMWIKQIDTEEFGKITIQYWSKSGDKTYTLIESKSMFIVDPSVFEK